MPKKNYYKSFSRTNVINFKCCSCVPSKPPMSIGLEGTPQMNGRSSQALHVKSSRDLNEISKEDLLKIYI